MPHRPRSTPFLQSTAFVAFLLSLFLGAVAHAKPPKALSVADAVLNFSALQPGQQAAAAIVVDVKDGFHAQSHTPSDPNYIPFEASLDVQDGIKRFEGQFPAGKEELFKSIDAKPLNVYTGRIIVYLPFAVDPSAKVGPLKLTGKISFQACDDHSCYPPDQVPFTIETQVVPLTQAVQTEHGDLFKGFDPKAFAPKAAASAAPPPAAPEQTFFGLHLTKNSYALAFLVAFLTGIVFNAVPCVLPVLPLKAIGFYEVSQHNRAKSIAFGAVFSLGLIASFAALALLVVVYHKVGWGEFYKIKAFNIAIVVILLVMAVGTFGAFSVNLPTAVYNITPRHDTYLGNFMFGILTAVLSTPCTFGLFAGLLVWAIGQPGLIGMFVVMTVGAGMASPYFVLSAFPELARKFPRTGPWSELVKQLMAFLLLGSAIFFARRFITPYTGADAFWWVMFGVAALAGLFLFIRTVQISPGFTARAVSFVIAAIVVGSAFAIVRQIVNQPFTWSEFTPDQLSASQKAGRVVVIDFTAAWCTNCEFLEIHTLHSPQVVQTVKRQNVEMVKADLTSGDAVGWPLLRELNESTSIPFTAVYGPGSAKPEALAGIYSPQALVDAIDRAQRAAVASR